MIEPSDEFWDFAFKFAKREHWFIGGFLSALHEAWMWYKYRMYWNSEFGKFEKE